MQASTRARPPKKLESCATMRSWLSRRSICSLCVATAIIGRFESRSLMRLRIGAIMVFGSPALRTSNAADAPVSGTYIVGSMPRRKLLYLASPTMPITS